MQELGSSRSDWSWAAPPTRLRAASDTSVSVLALSVGQRRAATQPAPEPARAPSVNSAAAGPIGIWRGQLIPAGGARWPAARKLLPAGARSRSLSFGQTRPMGGGLTCSGTVPPSGRLDP